MQPQQNGPLVGEKDHILYVVGRDHGRLSARGVRRGDGERPAAEHCGRAQARQQSSRHATISLIGLADLSTMRMGRPTFDSFCFIGSTPSARQTVARKSGTITGRSSTTPPFLPVLPMAWPPLMPPPARTALQPLG